MKLVIRYNVGTELPTSVTKIGEGALDGGITLTVYKSGTKAIRFIEKDEAVSIAVKHFLKDVQFNKTVDIQMAFRNGTMTREEFVLEHNTVRNTRDQEVKESYETYLEEVETEMTVDKMDTLMQVDESFTVEQLKDIARHYEVKGFSRMRKAELIVAVNNELIEWNHDTPRTVMVRKKRGSGLGLEDIENVRSIGIKGGRRDGVEDDGEIEYVVAYDSDKDGKYSFKAYEVNNDVLELVEAMYEDDSIRKVAKNHSYNVWLNRFQHGLEYVGTYVATRFEDLAWNQDKKLMECTDMVAITDFELDRQPDFFKNNVVRIEEIPMEVYKLDVNEGEYQFDFGVAKVTTGHNSVKRIVVYDLKTGTMIKRYPGARVDEPERLLNEIKDILLTRYYDRRPHDQRANGLHVHDTYQVHNLEQLYENAVNAVGKGENNTMSSRDGMIVADYIRTVRKYVYRQETKFWLK